MVMPKVTVAPPPPVPFRYGLQSVVLNRADNLDRVLAGGVEWDSQTCGWRPHGYVDPSCNDDVLSGGYVSVRWVPGTDPATADLYATPNLDPTAVESGARWAYVTVDGGPKLRVTANTLFANVTRGDPVTLTMIDPYSNTAGDPVTVTIPTTGTGTYLTGGETPRIAGGLRPTMDATPEAGPRDTYGQGPFSVFMSYDCAGVPADQARDVLQRRFEASEAAAVEEIVWYRTPFGSGMTSFKDSAYNPTSPDTATGIVDAVARLEEAFYWDRTELGAIHAPRWVYPLAANAGLIVRDRNQLRTPTDTLWAFGVGYQASNGPADATASAAAGQAWMYMTGPLAQWRSDVTVQPDAGASFDRLTNNTGLVAYRTYVVAWDCYVVSTLADLKAAAGGGGGF
jgi:hypothetical protein